MIKWFNLKIMALEIKVRPQVPEARNGQHPEDGWSRGGKIIFGAGAGLVVTSMLVAALPVDSMTKAAFISFGAEVGVWAGANG